MDTKLSPTQRLALLKAAADPHGRIVATRSTWAALVKRDYAVYGGDSWYDYTITPAGIEALGFNVSEILIKQARARVDVYVESEGRIRRNFHGFYRKNDIDEAVLRVKQAQFELAAIECAVGN